MDPTRYYRLEDHFIARPMRKRDFLFPNYEQYGVEFDPTSFYVDCAMK